MLIHFKHGSTTLRINHTKICFNTTWFLNGIQEMTKICNGSTDFQCTINNFPILWTSIVISNVTTHQIVTLSIHQSKTCYIRTDPSFLQLREIIAVDICHKIILLTFYINHVISQMPGFTVLPQKRTTIRSYFTRNHR